MISTRSPRWVLWLVVVVVVGLAGFWAGRVAFRPPSVEPVASSDSVIVAVTEQTVGRVLRLNTTVTQSRESVAVNSLSGVVTQVAKSGTFAEGDVLYAVAGVPVRAISGRTPFYRDLTGGLRGADVAQLRGALHRMGFLGAVGGSTMDLDAQTAVARWQRHVGRPPTGWLRQGELVAVQGLPAELSIDAKVARVSTRLVGGEVVVSAAAGTPVFVMELQSEQARQIPARARVTVAYERQQWAAVVAEATDTSGGTTLRLTAPGGGVVCHDTCQKLPAAAKVYLSSAVTIVAPATGPGVPVAAVTTQPDGTTTVTVVDGDRREVRPVQVLGSQDGIAVVSGVKAGEHVLALAEPQSSAAPIPTSTSSPR